MLRGVATKRLHVSELYSGMKETFATARVERGNSEWWGGGKTYRSGPGSLQLMKPGDVHRDLARDGVGVHHYICFGTELVECAGQVERQIEAGDPRGEVFHRLHDAVNAGATGLALDVAVTEAVGAFGAFGTAKVDLTRPVRRAIEMLRADVAAAISLDDLAAHAGLDKFHLCRAFRTQIGMPPHAYLVRLRIARAKQLLGEGVRPSEIAPRVGFYDQSALNRTFRRFVGVSPGQFSAPRLLR